MRIDSASDARIVDRPSSVTEMCVYTGDRAADDGKQFQFLLRNFLIIRLTLTDAFQPLQILRCFQIDFPHEQEDNAQHGNGQNEQWIDGDGQHNASHHVQIRVDRVEQRPRQILIDHANVFGKAIQYATRWIQIEESHRCRDHCVEHVVVQLLRRLNANVVEQNRSKKRSKSIIAESLRVSK